MSNYKKLVLYWLKTAAHDYDTMESLFKSKRYSDALFFGHIVLEKILKALFVQIHKSHAPYTHNLILLVEQVGLKIQEDELRLLSEINRFNMRARYPDVKLSFYKIATLSYTRKYLLKIRSFYKYLCQNLKELQ